MATLLKKILKSISFLIIIVVILFIGFYFWASSRTISDEKYNQGSILRIESHLKNKYKVKKTYSIITYNVGFGSGMANNLPVEVGRSDYDKNMKLIFQAVKNVDPDFLATQEIDIDSARSFHQNQVKDLADVMEAPHAAFLPNWSKKYVPFPYWPPAFQYGKMLSGQGIISKYPIISQKRYNLKPPEANPFYYNAFYLSRIIQETVVRLDGNELYIINVHLEAFDMPNRIKQTMYLLELYKKVKDKPVLLVGDFNCVPTNSTKVDNYKGYPEDTYRNDETMKMLLAEGSLTPAITEARYISNEKKFYTFSSGRPERKLDYIFYNDKIRFVKSRVINEAGTGSDHLPIYLEFQFKGK